MLTFSGLCSLAVALAKPERPIVTKAKQVWRNADAARELLALVLPKEDPTPLA